MHRTLHIMHLSMMTMLLVCQLFFFQIFIAPSPFSFFDVVVCKVKLGYIKNNCNISKWAYKLTKKLKQNKKLNTSLHIQFDLASLTTLD